MTKTKAGLTSPCLSLVFKCCKIVNRTLKDGLHKTQLGRDLDATKEAMSKTERRSRRNIFQTIFCKLICKKMLKAYMR